MILSKVLGKEKESPFYIKKFHGLGSVAPERGKIGNSVQGETD